MTTELQRDVHGRLRHLLTLDDLDRNQLELLLARAEHWLAAKRRGTALPNRLVASLFFEPSTRTRASFAIATRRLGFDLLEFDEKESSAAKGETIEDTVLNLLAMGVDAFVVRHAETGIPKRLAQAVDEYSRKTGRKDAVVVNAGESHVSHPTQGLLDSLTIRLKKNRDFGQLTVAIVGDILHSRVAASATSALRTLGVRELRHVGPAELLPADSATKAHVVVNDLDEGIRNCDVIMMLRIQRERMAPGTLPSAAQYHVDWGLNSRRLELAKPDCIVMHPGPVNREVELASDVMDGPQSVILDQVASGVAVRMAVLEELLAR